MPDIQHLMEAADWEAIWQAQMSPEAAPLLVFKRAPACATARVVEQKFMAWLDGLAAADAARFRVVAVDVVEQRQVAQQIAKDTLINHESPQALFFGPRRRRIWNASHWQIEREALDAALGKVK